MSERTQRKQVWTIGKQVFFLAFLLILLSVTTVGFLAVDRETNRIVEDAKETMRSLLSMEKVAYDLKYPGDWEVKDGHLYKGGVDLNENMELLTFIKNSTGHEITLFMGDTRIATTIQDASGKSVIGTKADEKISKQVLAGTPFYGRVTVSGTEIYSAYEPIQTRDGKIVGMLNMGDAELVALVDSTYKQSLRTFLIVALAVEGVAAMITYLFSTRIRKKLMRIESKLSAVTNGDLSTPSLPAGSRDELDSLTHHANQMNEDLLAIVTSIHEVSHQVAASSEELSAIAEETSASTEHVGSLTESLADRAEQQLQLVDRTSQTLDSIKTEMKLMSELSQEVIQEMKQAASEAKLSSAEGQEVLAQMQEVMRSTDQTYTSIHQLAERSGEIGGIAQTMSNLSKQTNLLALNAAIEASRAGESGRGFAVVATEIRKLAEQSNQAAHQVAELVQVILSDTQQAKEWITADREAVIAGTEKTVRINEALGTILAKATEVDRKLNRVDTSVVTVVDGTGNLTSLMDEVKYASDQAVESTHQVSASCEQQLAAMEEISSSSMALASLAEQLQTTLNRFKLSE
ncbi:methyl-accepting chemotaxis protein [Gorillibacterium sp. CAU 1737]|uniref:methyl-accepting chemotaxis protein n=1 Tax=Gorillibacterium sp. CAU 1737 TaxID=3140362 RepID=UPI00326098F1